MMYLGKDMPASLSKRNSNAATRLRQSRNQPKQEARTASQMSQMANTLESNKSGGGGGREISTIEMM